MSSPSNANDVLFAGGGAPALQWADPVTGQDYPVGTFYEGEITKTSAVQQRDIKDKSKVAVWPDGKPKYVALVTLQTAMRDPKMDEDDGQRTLWVSGKYLTNAVKDAVRQAGARQLEEGGYLKVVLTGYGVPQPGFRPPRYFEVAYRKPTPEKRAELAARQVQNAPYQVAGGDSSDPGISDPWVLPQNAFPQLGQPQQYDNAFPQLGQPQQTVPKTDFSGGPGNGVGDVSKPQAPVAGGFDGQATPASVANAPGGGQMDLSSMSPEARALVEKMYHDQQQGGTP